MLGMSHSVEVALGAASAVMFVATVVAVPVFFVKIPNDYFVRPRKKSSLPVAVLRNILGVALIALGVLMLVLPGQGILTILVGVSVLELPIKERVMKKLLSLPKVHHAIDALRRKAGKGSLSLPHQHEHDHEGSVTAA